MKNLFTSAFFGFVGCISSYTNTALALEEMATLQEPAPSYWDHPFRLLGNLGGGFTAVESKEYLNNPEGSQLNVGILFSWVSSRWVGDFGFGYLRTDLRAALANSTKIDFATNAPYIELSGRVRMGQRWQLGPVADFIFGAPNVYLPGETGNHSLTLLGLLAAYEMPAGDGALRFYFKAATNPDIHRQQVYTFSGGIQVGWPFGGSATLANEEVNDASFMDLANLDEMEPTSAPPSLPLKIVLSDSSPRFDSNSSDLNSRSKKVFSEISKILAAEDTEWEGLQIIGHADQRGSLSYNQKLSEERAEAVKGALVASGVNPEKLAIQGHSYRQPLDEAQTEEAYSKNRRVELVFDQVKNPEKLRSEIEKAIGSH